MAGARYHQLIAYSLALLMERSIAEFGPFCDYNTRLKSSRPFAVSYLHVCTPWDLGADMPHSLPT